MIFLVLYDYTVIKYWDNYNWKWKLFVKIYLDYKKGYITQHYCGWNRTQAFQHEEACCIVLSLTLVSPSSFFLAPEALKRYISILPHNVIFVISLYLSSYGQCHTQYCMMLLKVIYNYCNTDILRFLLICPQAHVMCIISHTPHCRVTMY